MLRQGLTAALALVVLTSAGCHRRRYYAQPVVVEAPPAPAAPAHQLNVTGAGRALARVTSDPVDELMPAIAPQGDVVLFETRVWQDRALVQQTIVGVDPETGATRTLFTSPNSKSSGPAWVPDGSSFVFASDSSGRPSVVRSMAAQPNAAISVIAGGDAAPNPGHPSVSPDGHRVAFHASIRGRTQIIVIGTDGSRLTMLGEGQRPAWSPDGKKIAFSRKVGEYSQIFMLNADSGTNLVQLTNDLADNDNPAWSPNGRVLLFNSNRGWDRAGSSRDAVWNIFAIQSNGTGLIQITDGDADSGAPIWGRDGWIYFHSNQAGNYDVWRLHPAGDFEALGTAAPAAKR